MSVLMGLLIVCGIAFVGAIIQDWDELWKDIG